MVSEQDERTEDERRKEDEGGGNETAPLIRVSNI